NVLFILTDDLGYGDLSLYGQTAYQTPNLDQLAQEGTRFTNAYSAQTVCTPTRVAFFTGRYPARTPVGLQEPLAFIRDINDRVGLPAEQPTIASLLKQNGYDTALVGKWHGGYPPTYGPWQNGFDEFFGLLSGGIDYFRHVDGNGELDLWEGKVQGQSVNYTQVNVNGYATDLFTDRAVDFIKRERDRPFYLSLHYNAPHWPFQGPDDKALSDELIGRDSVPNWINNGTPASYAAMMESLDQGVGKVLQALQESGQADNTIVVFTSDNGGEKFSNFGPYQGRKGSLYEGGIRVPAFVRWNGVIAPNHVTDQVLITQDLTATLLAATRTKPDPRSPLDGKNLLPVLQGRKPASARTLFWRFGANPANRQNAVRSGRWKYLSVRGNEFLFDLSTDPGETVNLKDERLKTFTKLKARFQEWESQVLPYAA
ncbi:MAG: sulfatase-like hydrolase/transferase, partial [Verrucomicrobia bacterium]|nr:sulfatase-like hydrolase/transferase [Leptolyngbya sp. ES-bin-22]